MTDRALWMIEWEVQFVKLWPDFRCQKQTPVKALLISVPLLSAGMLAPPAAASANLTKALGGRGSATAADRSWASDICGFVEDRKCWHRRWLWLTGIVGFLSSFSQNERPVDLAFHKWPSFNLAWAEAINRQVDLRKHPCPSSDIFRDNGKLG